MPLMKMHVFDDLHATLSEGGNYTKRHGFDGHANKLWNRTNSPREQLDDAVLDRIDWDSPKDGA